MCRLCYYRPPAKNAERVERYKLMIATSTGVVKDVYQVRLVQARSVCGCC